jgi:hypothetical protein
VKIPLSSHEPFRKYFISVHFTSLVKPMIPRFTYPNVSDRALFRAAVPQRRPKRRFDATTRILLMVVLAFAAFQLIW